MSAALDQTPYAVFLRATRPLTVTALSVVLGFATVVGLSASNPALRQAGGSTATLCFDALTIVLSSAFAWRERTRLIPLIQGRLTPGWVFAWAAATVASVVAAAYVQGIFFSTAAQIAASHAEAPPFLLATIIGPVAETLQFQGWIQTALERRLGPGCACFVTALIFYLVHMHFSAALVVAVALLCFTRMQTGSLGAVALAHAAINTVMFVLP